MAHPALKGASSPAATAPSQTGGNGPESLSPEELGALMVLCGFPANPTRIATGIGISTRESGRTRTASNVAGNSPPSKDRGPWQINDYWHKEVSDDCAYNWACSTKAANRISKGGVDWSQWSTYDSGIGAPYMAAAHKGIQIAQQAKGGGLASIGGALGQAVSAGAGNIVSTGSDIVSAAGDVVDFVGDFVATVLSFRKMGELMAKITAWFLKLILRAIWDYCIAPLFHWNERAVSFYWETYMQGNGPEGETGITRFITGITIMFWGIGYAVLFARAEPKAALTAPANETPLGRTIRSTQGQIARRHLTKPDKVKDKTPDKPEPVASGVPITRTRTLAAKRRRAVTVSSTTTERTTANGTGRQGRNSRRSGSEAPPRPTSATSREGQRESEAKRAAQAARKPPAHTAEPGRAELDSRRTSAVDAATGTPTSRNGGRSS